MLAYSDVAWFFGWIWSVISSWPGILIVVIPIVFFNPWMLRAQKAWRSAREEDFNNSVVPPEVRRQLLTAYEQYNVAMRDLTATMKAPRVSSKQITLATARLNALRELLNAAIDTYNSYVERFNSHAAAERLQQALTNSDPFSSDNLRRLDFNLSLFPESTALGAIVKAAREQNRY